jgi:uncharacterized protein (TIGR02302 family)
MKWMSGQPDDKSSAPRTPASELNRKVRRARLVIIFERLWPALWAPVSVIGLFLLLSIFGIWQYLGFEVHRGLLWGFGAALIVSLFPLIRTRWPSGEEALRRLETTAGLPHRPATSYHDTLADGAPSQVTSRIWSAHRERLARLFARLRAGWPHPRIDRWDPFALRTLLVLVLAVGYVAHSDDAVNRIKAAFALKPATSASLGRLDAWITPPIYTGQPPLMVADGARHYVANETRETHFRVPENSELTVRVNEADAARFALWIRPEAEAGAAPPSEDEPLGELIEANAAQGGGSTAQFKETLTDAGVIEVLEDGSPVASWTLEIIEDESPKITMTEPPIEAQRGSLRFKYHVEDDYGVLSAQAKIARAPGTEWDEDEQTPANVKRLGEAPDIPLTLPRANTKQGEGQTYRDLTGHFWAGLPVTITLEARDQAGQFGYSEPHKLTLPERSFRKPLARALIEQRKRLVDRPDRKDRVARALDALTIAPELFIKEAQIYLGMRAAFWRLTNSRDLETLESTANLLWEIAVHIEDGDLTDAERRLRMAQEKLMKALEDGASDEELKQLMDELRTALNEFMQSLAQQAMQNPEFDPSQQFSPDQMLSSQDLERMLKQIEDLARTGSRDAAKQMLSELRDLLENLQAGGQPQNGQAQEMMRNLDALSELIGKQQKLLDETYRAQQQGEQGQQGQQGEQGQQGQGQQGQGQQGQGGQGQSPFPGLGKQQGDLQKQLQDLMGQLRGLGAQAPNQLEGADQAMGNAGEALGQENAGQATEQQTLALDRLRQGARSLAEQMMQSMGQAGRMGRGTGGNADRDPLGRPLPTQGLDDGDSVKVPDESDIQRAREILEELRRRLGERGRPPPELDYIERLIERF